MNTYVIIPGYNEEKYIGKVAARVLEQTSKVIFVDDGSKDKTAEIAKKYFKHVLVHPINMGKGAALKTGCEYAFNELGADAVIFMDADDQHDPVEIPRFEKSLKEGNRVVFGTRNLGVDMPLMRLVGNKLASVFTGLVFGAFIPDIPSGYKALTKDAYEILKWDSTGYEVEMEIAAKVGKCKLPYALLPIKTIYHDKDKGMSVLDGLQIFMRMPIWRLNR